MSRLHRVPHVQHEDDGEQDEHERAGGIREPLEPERILDVDAL
jgi:hypothetical protein